MNDKSKVSKAFNKHFEEFLKDIKRIYPGEEIAYALDKFETFKKLNPTLIIKFWYSKVYLKFQSEIDSGNIDYFIQKDYSQELEGVAKAGDIIKMIDNIRKPIGEMDDDNKGHCKKYIKNLTKLACAYNSL